VVGQQNADIGDIILRDVAHGNHFCLSIYGNGVYIGATWQTGHILTCSDTQNVQ